MVPTIVAPALLITQWAVPKSRFTSSACANTACRLETSSV